MLAALSLLALQAQDPSFEVGPVPDWVERAELADAADVDLDEVVGGFAHLLLDTQTLFTGGQRATFDDQAWLVLDAQGVENGSSISIDFDPAYQTLTVHGIEVVRDGEVQDRLVPAAVQVLQREESLDARIYDGTLTALAFVEDVRPGDIVRHAYTVEGSNPAFRGHFFGAAVLAYPAPVQRVRYRLLWESERELGWTLHRGAPEPLVADRSGRKEYLWDVAAIAPTFVDHETPAWYFAPPWVQFTTFRDWAELARWESALFQMPREVSSELAREIEAIREAHAGPEARAQAAVRFVQDEIRYLGIELGAGAYEPSSPSVVYQRRFGDCKDKALLLVTMLRALEVEARPALVSWSFAHTVEQYAASPILFDHVIARIELPEGPVWVDPTESRVGGRLSAYEPPAFGHGLVASDAATELQEVRNPATPAKTRVTQSIEAVKAGAAASFTVVSRYAGRNATVFRDFYGWTTPRMYAKSCVDYYREGYGEVSTVVPLQVDDDFEGNVMTTVETYSLLDFWEPVEDGYEAAVIALELVERLPSIAPGSYDHPLQVTHPVRFEQTIQVRVGPDWDIETESLRLDNHAFRFRADIGIRAEDSGAVLELDYAYESKSDHVPPALANGIAAEVEQAEEFLAYELFVPADSSGGAETTPGERVLGGIGAFLLFLLALLWD